jgi:hypothetical protein
MKLWQRIRGLIGTTMIWGTVGAVVGAMMFVVGYHPWTWDSISWAWASRIFGAFVGGGALWGGACGLAFGMVLLAVARRQRFDELSSRRFLLSGAVAGAGFARFVLSAARRAPDTARTPASLPHLSILDDLEMPVSTRERTR